MNVDISYHFKSLDKIINTKASWKQEESLKLKGHAQKK